MKLLYITAVWSGDGEPNMHYDFVNEAAERGHSVTVLALCEKRNGVPTNFKTENGINYLTVKCGNIQKTNKYQKVISSVLANFYILTAANKYLKKSQFDMIVWSVSSTLMYYSINCLKKRYKAKQYMLLKEYWPQDPVDLGAMSEGGFVYRVLKYVEKTMMNNADYIGVSSPAGIKYVDDRYPDNTHKCEVCPHCETPRNVDKTIRKQVFEEFGIPEDKTVFLYGGNFGISQGIDDMVACIKAAAENENAFFAMLGSGTEYARAKAELEGLSNVRFYSGLKYQKFLRLAAVCDCGMIFLFKDYNVPNIPGKLNTYLNAEIPIIACVDKTTDAGDILEEAGAGIKVYSGDTEAFCNAVETMFDKKQQNAMAQNAKKLLCEKFTPINVMNIIEESYKVGK
ncbi:MAG: glycosyltransferase family 4 protein [Clostridia bacterium]|nr:glycosyltransferase family 4 protein [Clostridia bacterium]